MSGSIIRRCFILFKHGSITLEDMPRRDRPSDSDDQFLFGLRKMMKAWPQCRPIHDCTFTNSLQFWGYGKWLYRFLMISLTITRLEIANFPNRKMRKLLFWTTLLHGMNFGCSSKISNEIRFSYPGAKTLKPSQKLSAVKCGACGGIVMELFIGRSFIRCTSTGWMNETMSDRNGESQAKIEKSS